MDCSYCSEKQTYQNSKLKFDFEPNSVICKNITPSLPFDLLSLTANYGFYEPIGVCVLVANSSKREYIRAHAKVGEFRARSFENTIILIECNQC